MPDPSLRAALNSLDANLAMSLARSRAAFRNKTLKGDGCEFAVREALHSHLPLYHFVGTGEVIDLSGTRSAQVDVVIANEYQPFRTGIHENGLFLVEGVGAAGESKALLKTEQLAKTLETATLFKKLRMQGPGALMQLADNSGRGIAPECPPYFLFAFEIKVAQKTLLKRLAEADLVNAADGTGQALSPVDAVFILGRGAAINFGDGRGTFSYRYPSGPSTGELATGWVWLPRDSGIFTFFLLWLNAVMQRVLRLRPIASSYLARAVDS